MNALYKQLRPRACRRAESLALSERFPDSSVVLVKGIEGAHVTPPLRGSSVCDIQAHYNEDGGDKEAGIESGGGDVVLFA